MKPKQAITPLPWAVFEQGNYTAIGNVEEYQAETSKRHCIDNPMGVCEMMDWDDVKRRHNHRNPLTRANAAFIVRACNAHSELVEALRQAVQLVSELKVVCDCGGPQTGSPEQSGWHNADCAIGIILNGRAAIAKAEGRP